MGEIKQLKNLATTDSLERIIAAARENAGFWLMVKEREMEMRAITAELARLGLGESEVDRLFPERLKPSISELADDLVSRLFGTCPPEILIFVQDALLDTAKTELNSNLSQPS